MKQWLTWPEVEREGRKKTPLLLPVSIIEEHGPHMDLAPDIYLVHQLAKDIKKRLLEQKIDILITPPLYWGISRMTAAFPGTFSVRPSTMIALMEDIVTSLKKWGFDTIFVLNLHGAPDHNRTIVKGIEHIRQHLGINIFFPMGKEEAGRMGLKGTEEFILQCDGDMSGIGDFEWSEYADLHAGGLETSSMLKYFPGSVREDTISGLEDSKVSWEKAGDWNKNPDKAREILPLGYCGNPGNINIPELKKLDDVMIDSLAAGIGDYLVNRNNK
jgi:creatinine amidohydrolase